MLNARLLACAAFVRQDAHVCDVGTDHALLPVYLLEQDRAAHVIAADIATGPLQAAQRTIAAHGLTGKIETILSDGLADIPPEGLTDIVIAGMGGETIIHILETCPFDLQGIRLILQPMTKAEILRELLYLHGFSIAEETFVQDGKFIYVIMRVTKTGVVHVPDVSECWFGQADLSVPEGYAYAERQLKRLQQYQLHVSPSDREQLSAIARTAATMAKRLEEYRP